MTDSILITAISPFLLILGGLISWVLKSRKESLQLAEERSREKRLETYKIILDPYIVMTTPTAKQSEKDKALGKITTVDYKRASFDLVTFGSDDTVRSYNKLMQHFFSSSHTETEDSSKHAVLLYFSELVLNIRKDLYSKRTRLKRSETIEFTINDIQNHRGWLDKN